MKRTILAITAIAITLGMQAQDKRQGDGKFSPEKFDADLRNYITTEARLTQQEAATFFPLYKEMQHRQRTVFDKQRQLAKEKPKDEEGCRQAIDQRDEMDIELKRIQQSYHQRFFKVLPPSKVYDILKAERRFHRKAMQNWGKHKAENYGKPKMGPPQNNKRPQK